MTDTVSLTPGANYALVVAAAKTSFLLSNLTNQPIMIARMAADATLPNEAIEGHLLWERTQGLTRAALPSGAIWAKVVGGREGKLARDTD